MRRPDHRWAAEVSSSQLFTKHLGDSGYFRMYFMRTSLVVQWLRLRAPYAEGPRSIPGQRASSHMLQLRVCKLKLKIPHAAKTMEDSMCHNPNLAQPSEIQQIKINIKKRVVKMLKQCEIGPWR